MAKKILLVDDDADLANIVSLFLRENGYETTMANNGKECLDKLPEYQPDLILLDLEMPIMDGFQTCEKIREIEGDKKTPIIFLTGLDRDWDLIVGYTKGCDSYIVKGHDSGDSYLEIVLAEVKKLLN